ncbi:MAG: C25 family cysteine peptidase [Candidatus Thorarchaeota archaeon]
MTHLYSKRLKYYGILLLILLPIISFLLNSTSVLPYSTTYFKGDRFPNINSEINGYLIPDINYNSINDLWYNPKIEMLIISPNKTDFINALQPLMDWKNEKGVKTITLSNFSLYGGKDDAEKVRNMIKTYYEQEDIRWVLLAGDAQEDLIPIRKVYNPDVFRWGGGRTETIPGENYKPTDFYYADLNGTWDSDEDNDWGEAPQDNTHYLDEISWIPEVYVGRFPANDANELEIMVNKTIKYEKSPNIGDWMNKMLLGGGVSSWSVSGQDSGEYESALTNYIIQNYAQSKINYTHLIRESENLTRSNLKNYFNNGYSTVIFAGHGSYNTYYIDPSTVGFTTSDAALTSNDFMPSLVYLDACSTSSFDANDDNIGETLIKKIDSGAIGVIGGLRVTWYFEDDIKLEKLNRGNAKLFWEEFYQQEKHQQGRALYDSKVSYINSDYYNKSFGSTNLDFERKNILTYNLLGDPEVDVYTNKPQQAKNPFNDNYYEGQLATITIRDIYNQIIPYARVHFKSSNGKYCTVYADRFGIAKFRLPPEANETYNVTITGHNLIPTYYNFTTIQDSSMPELLTLNSIPKNPITSDLVYFNAEIIDNNSGIESVYLILSEDNFETYSYYSVKNGVFENKNNFILELGKMKPGIYTYSIISRDYANNSRIFQDSSYVFIVPNPIIDYILPVSLILIVGIAGISGYILLRELRKFIRNNTSF